MSPISCTWTRRAKWLLVRKGPHFGQLVIFFIAFYLISDGHFFRRKTATLCTVVKVTAKSLQVSSCLYFSHHRDTPAKCCPAMISFQNPEGWWLSCSEEVAVHDYLIVTPLMCLESTCFAIKHALALQLNKREEGVQLLFEYLMSFTFFKLLLFDLMIWLLVSLWNGTCTSRFSFMDSTCVCADAPRTETKHCVCGGAWRSDTTIFSLPVFLCPSSEIPWNEESPSFTSSALCTFQKMY